MESIFIATVIIGQHSYDQVVRPLGAHATMESALGAMQHYCAEHNETFDHVTERDGGLFFAGTTDYDSIECHIVKEAVQHKAYDLSTLTCLEASGYLSTKQAEMNAAWDFMTDPKKEQEDLLWAAHAATVAAMPVAV